MRTTLVTIVSLLLLINISLKTYSQNSEAILWQSSATDRVHGSPVILGDKLFIGSVDGRLHAIDLLSGRKYYHQDMGGRINSTPILYGQNIILVAGNDLVCFDPVEVVIKWRFEALAEPGMDAFDQWDYHHSSPVVHNDLVYYGAGNGFLYEINPVTGEKARSWETSDFSAIRTTPKIVDEILYFGDWSGKIYALDLATSEYRWSSRTWTGEHFDNFAGILSEIEVGESYLYYGARNSTIKALNKNTGTEVWSFSSPDGGWISGDPLLYGNLLLIGGSDNHKMLSFNAVTGELLWEYQFPGNCFSRPIIANDKIIFTTGNAYANVGLNYGKGFIHALSLPSGELYKEVEFPGNAFSNPILHNGNIYLGCDNKSVYAIDGFELAGLESSSVNNQNYFQNRILIDSFKSYPNPMDKSVNFSFSLANPGSVKIIVTDLIGKVYKNLDLGLLNEGSQLVSASILSGTPSQILIAKLHFNNKPAAAIRIVTHSLSNY